MKKTGKTGLYLFFLYALLLIPVGQGLAQNGAEVSATVSETTAFTGERISLSVKVSGSFSNISRPELPQFPGFRLLSSTPSTSRSYSMINGQTSSSYTYSYYLVAQKEGQYQIPEITISIDGKEMATEPIAVRIVDRNSSAENTSPSSRPEVFLRMEISDKTPVTGQQLIADLVLYFKDGLEVTSYQPVPGWKAEGFWKEELESNGAPRAESTIMGGMRYRKARLMQFSLFPTKTGELTVSPYQIVVSVRSPSSRNDAFSSFFGGFGNSQRQVELSTDPLQIQVRGLPPLPDGSYTGAVGSFTIDRTLSATKVQVGESVEIQTTVRGTGNIPLVNNPQYPLPDGLEQYAPEEKSTLDRKGGRISGRKLFTTVVIPRKSGSYTIPEKRVAYFDPSTNRYEHTTLPPVTFDATPAPAESGAAVGKGTLPVQPITGLATWSREGKKSLYGHWWLWAGLLLPLLVLALAYRQKRYSEKMSSDTAFARSRRAYDVASERLEEAIQRSEGGHVKEAYNLLQKALTGFIGDRLDLAEAGLSTEAYVKALQERQVDPKLVKNVRMLLDKCATISYAPDTPHAYLKSHVGLAESILDKLKKEL